MCTGVLGPRHRKVAVLIAVLAWLQFSALSVTAAPLEQQRRDYLEALQALDSGDLQQFERLYHRLDGYILQNFLRYSFLKDHLAATPKEEIVRFLHDNQYAFIVADLRAQWLGQLASAGDWETFMAHYRNRDNDPALQCYRLQYLLKTRADIAALAPQVEKLWLSDTRLPAVCNPVFDVWRKSGRLSDELIWSRIELLMQRNQSSFAGELADEYLDAKERIWLRRWRAMQRNPLQALRSIDYPLDTARARKIVKDGVVRLGYRDPEAAMDEWKRLLGGHPELAPEGNEIVRELGILATQRHLPVGAVWLFSLPDDSTDAKLHLWRLRAALVAGDWQRAKWLLAQLSPPEQQERLWWYWTARIMEQTGNRSRARDFYTLLAQDRHYYSFLAADRLHQRYAMQHQPLEVSAQERQTVLSQPGIRAAGELFAVGDLENARKQWNWAIEGMSPSALQAAAVVARDWGWYGRAIATVSKSGYTNDIDLRFPLLYRDIVEANAEAHDLDPSWIYGVMRQESGFVVDARSAAGALGLMQLLPHVGRMTARRLNLAIADKDALLEVENNLRLGSAFLQNLLHRYNGHELLATAAYNAGPNRVKTWLPRDKPIDADVWVETIPYDETREYVKNVMAYTVVYDHRLQRPLVRLCERMPAVAPKPDVVTKSSACGQPLPAAGANPGGTPAS
jgi:soluble lytic murein transglycosylase